MRFTPYASCIDYFHYSIPEPYIVLVNIIGSNIHLPTHTHILSFHRHLKALKARVKHAQARNSPVSTRTRTNATCIWRGSRAQ